MRFHLKGDQISRKITVKTPALQSASQLNVVVQEGPGSKILLIPNPASEWIDVLMTGHEKGLCLLSVYNEVNQLTSQHEFNCSDKSYRLNTSNWRPGIYTVRIVIDQENSITAKLVIIR